MGQNGSGKSTLIKVARRLSPARPGDAAAELDGEPFNIGHVVPDGLRFVHQDLGLVLELSAQDNLALHGGFAKGFGGRVLWREQEKETRRLLERFAVDIDIHQPLAAATPVERTVVAIAAALQGWHGGGGLLVLDEPTAVLPHDEVERLFAVVEEVRKAGTAILYVSHRMDEIFQLADRVTILRGGKLVATKDIAEIDPRGARGPDGRRGRRPGLPRSGRRASPTRRSCSRRATSPGKWLRGVDLKVHKGEILGHRRARRRGRARAPVRDHGPCAARRQGDRRAAPAAGRRRVARRQRAEGRQHPARPRRPPARGRDLRVRASARTCRCRSSAGSAARASSGCARRREAVEEWSRRLEIKTESPGRARSRR